MTLLKSSNSPTLFLTHLKTVGEMWLTYAFTEVEFAPLHLTRKFTRLGETMGFSQKRAVKNILLC